MALYLRIGSLAPPKETYIVKNIYDLLQAYTEKETYTVNKQYQFRLDKRALQKEDQKILAHLARSAQTHQLLGTSGLQIREKLGKRYLLLPVGQTRFLLRQMDQTTRLYLRINGQNDQGIQFSDQSKPLSFKVEKRGEDYLLQALNDFDFFFMHYQWGLIQGVFYSLTKYQQTVYQTWKQLIRQLEKPEIIFKKKELPALSKEVIPPLSETGDVVVTPEVEKEVADIPVEFVFFFRKAKGKIQARVDSVYGEVIYLTDPKHEVSANQDFQALRDRAEEKRVLDLFRVYRYQKNETGHEYSLPSGEELYAFSRIELSVSRQFGEVRLGRKLRELYLDVHKHQPQVEVTEIDSWLDIRFDVSGTEKQGIDHVLQNLLQSDASYTLENGQVLSFDSEEFQQTSQVLQQLRESTRSEEGTIHVPKNQGLITQNQLERSNATLSESFQTMVQNLIHPEGYQVQLPKGLNVKMREYQKQGFRWLKMLGHYQFGGILVDEMGLGKTLQTIAFLLSEKEERESLSALIVAPASSIYN